MGPRFLRPNSQGIIVETKPHMSCGSPLTRYVKPLDVLPRINRLMGGEAPSILVQRGAGGIGDVLMTLPTVRAIKEKYKGPVDYATDVKYLDGALVKVLKGNPYIDNILNWQEVKRENYDGVIDLHCPCVSHEQAQALPINRIDLFARHARIQLQNRKIDLVLTKEELDWARDYIERLKVGRFKLMIVQPNVSTKRRSLPSGELQKAVASIIAKQKDVRALIFTHKGDEVVLPWSFNGVLEVKNLDVRQIASLIHYSSLVLCQDSAILHVAGALEKPTLSFFGPTDPRARVNYYKKSIALWPGGQLRCSPSWYSPCKCGEVCWKMIKQEMIVDTALDLLNNRPIKESPDIVNFNYREGPQFFRSI